MKVRSTLTELPTFYNTVSQLHLSFFTGSIQIHTVQLCWEGVVCRVGLGGSHVQCLADADPFQISIAELLRERASKVILEIG